MQFKMANKFTLTHKIKKSAISPTDNACKDLEKEIHSLCWYNGINQILKSMEQVICLSSLKKLAL